LYDEQGDQHLVEQHFVGAKHMFMRVFDLAFSASPATRRLLIRLWYQYLARLDTEAYLLYMNYGYAPLAANQPNIQLRESDEKNRYCIQLYHHIASAIDLKQRDVLEIGCGRGGGAAYIARYLTPHSIQGIDISDQAIAFCNSYHALDGLSFAQGDAESLPCENNSFDTIINLESSHCYGSMERFLAEVVRVLRPEGYFLFADLRRKEQVDLLRKQLRYSGLMICKEQNITLNVLRALDLDNERKLELIRQKCPTFLRKRFEQFAGIKGTKTYELFQTVRRIT